jgi:hypothetical protein
MLQRIPSTARRLLLPLPLVLAATTGHADSEDDWPAWADEADLMEQVAAVSDGELRFLPVDATAGEHTHLNQISITAESFEGGWVALEQCHENIDAVPAAQILFRAGGIRDLTIQSSRNIGRAWVEGHSVQLEDVGADAVLCIRAESQALRDLGDGRYRLRNGPYMRRFLDGYYPMRVTLDIRFPASLVEVVGQSPSTQPGFSVQNGGAQLSVDATFEGRLVTCFDFCRRGGDCSSPPPACEEG